MPILKCVSGCNTTHSFQDKKYGHKRRVFNPTMKKEGLKALYRCTVCGSLRTIHTDSAIANKPKSK